LYSKKGLDHAILMVGLRAFCNSYMTKKEMRAYSVARAISSQVVAFPHRFRRQIVMDINDVN